MIPALKARGDAYHVVSLVSLKCHQWQQYLTSPHLLNPLPSSQISSRPGVGPANDNRLYNMGRVKRCWQSREAPNGKTGAAFVWTTLVPVLAKWVQKHFCLCPLKTPLLSNELRFGEVSESDVRCAYKTNEGSCQIFKYWGHALYIYMSYGNKSKTEGEDIGEHCF